MSIGKRMKEKRLERGYTLVELAEKINVVHSTIIRYENGSITKFSIDQIEKLAQILDVSPGWLMFGDGGSKIQAVYDRLNEPNKKTVMEFAEFTLEKQEKS